MFIRALGIGNLLFKQDHITQLQPEKKWQLDAASDNSETNEIDAANEVNAANQIEAANEIDAANLTNEVKEDYVTNAINKGKSVHAARTTDREKSEPVQQHISCKQSANRAMAIKWQIALSPNNALQFFSAQKTAFAILDQAIIKNLVISHLESKRRFIYASDNGTHYYGYKLYPDSKWLIIVSSQRLQQIELLAFYKLIGESYAENYRGPKKVDLAAVLQKIVNNPLQFIKLDPGLKKIAQINKDLKEINAIMVNNISQFLKRQEKIDDLVVQANELHMNAKVFRTQAQSTNKGCCWR